MPNPSADDAMASRPQTTRQQAIEQMLVIARKDRRFLSDTRGLRILKKVLANSGSDEGVDPYELERESRMDFWRVSVTLVLILGLIASIIWALAQADNGAGGETRAQYISLVSGLAGIAIGWLFGSTNSGGRRVIERSTPPKGDDGRNGGPAGCGDTAKDVDKQKLPESEGTPSPPFG